MRDLVGTVVLLGVLQGAVLAPALWARQANRFANRILAALVAAVALMLLLGDLEGRWGFQGHPNLLGLTSPLPFLFGPLLFLYASALTRPLVRFDPRWLAHGLPFAGDVLFMAQAFYLKSGAEKIALARATHAGTAPMSLHIVIALEVTQAFVYLFLTWQVLERYGTKMRGFYSDLARIDLRWLKALVLAHAGVWSVVLLKTVLGWTGSICRWGPDPTGNGRGLGAAVQLGTSFVVFLTGYVSLWQPELVQKASAAKVAAEDTPRPADPHVTADPPKTVAPAALAPEPSVPKYQRNRLDDDEAREVATKLQALMAREEMYRDTRLTLHTLADALGVTPHTLSQILNVFVGSSFFVFVNGHRAEALKRALADASKSERGVLELAFEVGFNSKSTLNSFFKKHTGMTPTEFRGRARSSKIPEKSRG
jgi:AraC-like DNA-binding protein